jgi:hypothetical protein
MKFFKKQVDQFDYEIERTCLTCESKFQGKFCSRCGEKVIESYDRSVKHFFDNLLNAFTFIDGKFFNSFRTLLLQPGKMSADIAIGRRQPYMKPVAFFFVGNFIYFFFPMFPTFNSTLYAQLYYMEYSEWIEPSFQKYLQAASIDYHVFEEKYNAASTNWAKILLILIVPLTFPFMFLINYAKRLFLSDHLIFTFELASYILFVPTILLSFLVTFFRAIAEMVGLGTSQFESDGYILPVVAILTGYMLFFGLKRFYQFNWWRIIFSTVALLASLVVVIYCYRFLLFEITMWSLK